ncbi:MarR family winged helix-turn-helix transcriptional regulator [Pseudonocardia sp. NPDC049635]|uniref:MarR family winged helix-turn-helix transcriptional regulator n=1 Tax=Pseudonocardia sp. NPDC049635 TaxID=3155506 RepID=UPI0033C11DEA
MNPETSTAAATASPAGSGDEQLGWALGVLVRAYQAALGGVVADFPHGLRGYEILASVVEEPQPSQQALAARLGIDPSVLVYVLDDLVEAGLVERCPNPADRRQRMIVATGRGSDVFEVAAARVAEAENDVLGALSAEEQNAFRTMLCRVACSVRTVDVETDPCAAAAVMIAAPSPRPARRR